MASTTPSVSFPVRWSCFITIETREPRLILARSVPAILGNLPFLLLRCGSERGAMHADLDLSLMIVTGLTWVGRDCFGVQDKPRVGQSLPGYPILPTSYGRR